MLAKKILVVAPHPDDETLGAGGTLLRMKAEGSEIHWLIMTTADGLAGFSDEFRQARKQQIEEVSRLYRFDSVSQMAFVATRLDQYPLGDVIQEVSGVVKTIKPDLVLIPSEVDIHSDHQITYQAALSATKWFRYPSVRRVMTYETLSETEYGAKFQNGFFPHCFVDIGDYLNQKIQILNLYASEVSEFPFPRSEEAVRSLARLRGSASGVMAAESFQIIKERV